MIKKAGGKYRMCPDFRRINSITKRDLYPIPLINVDMLRLAKYISKIYDT